MRRTYSKIDKKIILACLLTVLVAVIPLSARSLDQQTWPIYANVEQGGKLIAGLEQTNFRVLLDNQPQPFDLEPAETPMSIALLVEYSQQSWRYLSDIQYAIESFTDNAPEGNWYALATFDHATKVVMDFTKQKGQIAPAFAQLGQPEWNETDTYDAIYNMVDTMSRLPGRRAIIFVGSGVDSFSKHSLKDVEKALEAADVTVYALGAGSAFRGAYEPYLGTSARMDLFQAQAFLRMLGSKTGGEAWFPNMDIGFRDAMKGVMQDLSMQYKIVLKGDLPSDGRLHKIKVEAFTVTDGKRKDFSVRVRDVVRLPET